MGSTFGCQHPQINTLWSVWYCTMALAFQIYIIVVSIRRFTKYISLPWPLYDQPYFELNAYVGFIGAAVVMLPFFVVAAILKVGNYANDGYKIGSADNIQSAVYQNLKRRKCSHWLKTIWRHGGPTAPFLHLAAAFCLLLPRLLIHAQLIKHGFLSKDGLWKTDVDFLMTHRDRLVALSFLSTVNETELWQREAAEAKTSRNHPDVQLDDVSPISSEYLNYATALLVYAVRYPSVFWNVNKCFGLIFSFQLILNGLQQLLAFTGFAVLYKVQIYGPRVILMRFTPLLLNVPLSVLLFLVYNVVMTLSGSVLYMYGLQKHREFLDRGIQKHHVTWRSEARRLWGYIPHVSAFLVVLLIGLSAAPLMYDYTLVYCGSLDGAVLAAVTGTVMHLFLWIVLWLMLTVKQKWSFNSNGIQYSHSMCNGHAGKVPNEHMEGRRAKEAPLLVIDNGQTFQVREKMSKKAILTVAQKSIASRRQLTPSDDDDIYWLKPKPPSPKDTKSSPETDRLNWIKNQRKSPGTKHKVTFEEGLLNTSPCKRTRSISKSPKSLGKNKKNVKLEDLSDSNSEEGDYATLKDLPPPPRPHDEDGFEIQSQEDMMEEVRKLGNGDYELLLEENTPNHQISTPVVVHNSNGMIIGNVTPKSTRSTDSGASKGSMEQNSTPRGSVSETCTTPDRGGGSDSSSGVHSNSSGGGDKRSTSMENLTPISFPRHAWKSMSLQRNVATTPGVMLHGSQTYRPDPGIYYDPRETTMVIWRKAKTNKDGTTTTATGEQSFGRATNMRMTSFSDQPDYGTKTAPTSPRQIINQNRSNTLGHYSKPLNPHLMMAPGVQMQRRDSANYSLTSSGESDNYMSQC